MRKIAWLCKSLFSRKSEALVFVDYEYWFYTMRNLLHIAPDAAAWLAEITEKYTCRRILFCADFSSPGLFGEKEKLEKLSVDVVDTAENSTYRKKDMTDFVLLDEIYQSIDREKRVKNYILFTGDGHFQSVARYLKEKKKKNVILYGILNSVSRRLQEAASSYVLLPGMNVQEACYRRMVVENFAYIADKDHILPTFMGTAEAIARRNAVPSEEVQRVMRAMLDEGLIERRDHYVEFRRTIKIIAPVWDKLIAEGYWDPEKQCALQKVPESVLSGAV